jgi:hypothetical protein
LFCCLDDSEQPDGFMNLSRGSNDGLLCNNDDDDDDDDGNIFRAAAGVVSMQ